MNNPGEHERRPGRVGREAGTLHVPGRARGHDYIGGAASAPPACPRGEDRRRRGAVPAGRRVERPKYRGEQ